jgi:uroporphyrinogen-III synthase
MTGPVYSLHPEPAAPGPLAGLGVLVTRPARQAAPFAQKLTLLGAAPVVFPAIAILPPSEPAPLTAALAALDRYDAVVFVSANAVEFGAPPAGRWPPRLCAYAPGPATAEALAAVGVADIRIPATTPDSEGLLALPSLQSVAGQRVLVLRGDGGRDLLADTLRARGATVDQLACYRRVRPANADGLVEAFRGGRIAVATVTSSEGIDNLWALLDAATRSTWRRCPTFAPHPRIAAHARTLELDVIETATGDGGLIGGLLEWAARNFPRN